MRRIKAIYMHALKPCLGFNPFSASPRRYLGLKNASTEMSCCVGQVRNWQPDPESAGAQPELIGGHRRNLSSSGLSVDLAEGNPARAPRISDVDSSLPKPQAVLSRIPSKKGMSSVSSLYSSEGRQRKKEGNV